MNYKNKEEYQKQILGYKSLCRDITFDEFLYMQENGIVRFYFDICHSSVYCDKFFISIQDEYRHSKKIIETFHYPTFKKKLDEIRQEVSTVKSKSKYNVISGKFPYTYQILRSYEKQQDNKEKLQEYAEGVNTPPVEVYQEEINNIKF